MPLRWARCRERRRQFALDRSR